MQLHSCVATISVHSRTPFSYTETLRDHWTRNALLLPLAPCLSLPGTRRHSSFCLRIDYFIEGKLWASLLYVWLILLSISSSRFIHIAVYVRQHKLFKVHSCCSVCQTSSLRQNKSPCMSQWEIFSSAPFRSDLGEYHLKWEKTIAEIKRRFLWVEQIGLFRKHKWTFRGQSWDVAVLISLGVTGAVSSGV